LAEAEIEPGAHVVEAKLGGYLGAKEAVQIEKGAARTIELRLAAITPVEAPSGEGVDSAKPKGGGASGTESAASDGGLRKKVIIAGIASSAAAITGGVVFAIVSSVKASDAEDLRTALVEKGGSQPCLSPSLAPDCKAIENTIGAQETFLNLSVWSFVGGGVLGVGTAIYALASPKPKPANTVRVMPIMSSSTAGVVLAGRW
jgi:hypothetical protein